MKITKAVIEMILIHAKKDAPIETCGFLMGPEGFITHSLEITNMEQRPDHFTFDPKEQFAAYRTVKELGIEIIGAYHSHPATPAQPSEEDIRLAFDPKLLYMIVSLADDVESVKAFYIRNGNVEEEPLIVDV
jgi:[CysO sulfur-carrier protein]-S-L-cysteine hydrolase